MEKNIDIVYLWVDGNDPEWQAKRNAFINIPQTMQNDALCDGRYTNNDELKYSLRSIEKHAPWIRKIFIITDKQTPSWLNTFNPKIQIIDHSEIIPEYALPCFNSETIEYFIYKIPDLSEHFIYANDDMFLNKDVLPSNFFTKTGKTIVRLRRKPLGKLHYKWYEIFKGGLVSYKQTLLRASNMVAARCGKRYWGAPHHNIDSYLKSDYKSAVENVFKDIIESSSEDKVRKGQGLQRIAFSYYSLALKHAVIHYISEKESYYSPLYKIEKLENFLIRYKPSFFCLNDDERAADKDRILAKEFLSRYFSEKSIYEI